jgi:GntR family transcriptional regulator of vanillate catabolism
MNRRFHMLIARESRNPALAHSLALNDGFPFAAAGALAFQEPPSRFQYKTLNYAHMQHHAIATALEDGDSVRAEALMREHTNVSKESLRVAGDRLFHAAKAAC